MEALSRFLQWLQERWEPERVLIFGSQARGCALRDSDLDLLVVSQRFEGIPLTDRATEIYLHHPWPGGLDCLCLTPEEFASLAQRSSFIQAILHEEPTMETHRPETDLWLRQSEADLDTATHLLRDGIFYASVFFAQQAAEKALKALWIEHQREAPPRTHDLVALARQLEAPEGVVEAAAELAPEYLLTRYPSPEVALPVDLYTQSSAQRHWEAAQQVRAWVLERLGLGKEEKG